MQLFEFTVHLELSGPNQIQIHLVAQGELFLKPNKKKLWLCKCYKLTEQKSAPLPNQSVTHMMQEMRDLAATSSEDRNPSISPHNFLEAWHIIRKFCFHSGSEKHLPPFRVSCSSELFFIGRRTVAATAQATSFILSLSLLLVSDVISSSFCAKSQFFVCKHSTLNPQLTWHPHLL